MITIITIACGVFGTWLALGGLAFTREPERAADAEVGLGSDIGIAMAGRVAPSLRR